LCGETRCGCNEQEYKTKIEDAATRCLEEAKANGVEKWVEVSTAQVYDPDKAVKNEASKIQPWTTIAKYRLKVEALVKASGIPAVILRPAIVYGPGDLTGLSPRIMCAVAYSVLKEKMKFLWTESLLLNTVHVDDVCQAIWLAAIKGKAGAIFNVADRSALDQGTLNTMLGKMFGIETGFLGSVLSNMAKLNLASVASDANDKHVPAWAKACDEAKILNTPLSPYIDQELLYNNHLSVDGSAISKELGMTYKHPECTIETLAAQVKGFEEQGIFPPGYLKDVKS
jgi:nucleoside-diphosphate-sugar epimerase